MKVKNPVSQNIDIFIYIFFYLSDRKSDLW